MISGLQLSRTYCVSDVSKPLIDSVLYMAEKDEGPCLVTFYPHRKPAAYSWVLLGVHRRIFGWSRYWVALDWLDRRVLVRTPPMN